MKKTFVLFLLGAFLVAPFLLLSWREISIRNARMLLSASVSAFPTPESVPGEVVVRFKEKSNQQRGQSFKSYWCSCQEKNLKKVKASEERRGCRVSTDGKSTEEILHASRETEIVYSQTTSTKQQHNQNFWNIGNDVNSGVNADLVWGDATGAGVTVAIVDSGIDWDHPDLVANHWTNAEKQIVQMELTTTVMDTLTTVMDGIFIGRHILLLWKTTIPDNYGHGTHVWNCCRGK